MTRMLDQHERVVRYLSLSHLFEPTKGARVMPDHLYVLPDLPYDPGALEPHISGRIMELHHDKHHAAYVKGANTALEKLQETRTQNDFATISMLERNLAFHVSGHVLHSVFWTNLSPDGGEPSGALADAL